MQLYFYKKVYSFFGIANNKRTVDVINYAQTVNAPFCELTVNSQDVWKRRARKDNTSDS